MKISMGIAAAVVATALALPGVAGAVTYGGGGGSYGGGGGGSHGGGGWNGHTPAPVPLPAALPLLVAGIGLMGAAASRRRRADRTA
jgi:hypothetical protein